MSEDPYTLSFEPVEEPPPMKAGDSLTVIHPDGTASFLVTKAEPLDDEEGRAGHSVQLIAWPGS